VGHGVTKTVTVGHGVTRTVTVRHAPAWMFGGLTAEQRRPLDGDRSEREEGRMHP
jgi:hypothetical protein